MKVIFLDVDGVLTTTKTILSYDLNEERDTSLYYYSNNNVNNNVNNNNNQEEQEEQQYQEENDDNDEEGEGNLIPLEITLINNLKEIINQTNAKIVITSTWRLIEEMRKFLIRGLVDNGIPKDCIIGDTIRLSGAEGRGAEIRLWLNENNLCTNYVIIDDEHMNSFKRYGLQENVVQTILKHEDPSLEGLTVEHTQRAIEILLSKE